MRFGGIIWPCSGLFDSIKLPGFGLKPPILRKLKSF